MNEKQKNKKQTRVQLVLKNHFDLHLNPLNPNWVVISSVLRYITQCMVLFVTPRRVCYFELCIHQVKRLVNAHEFCNSVLSKLIQSQFFSHNPYVKWQLSHIPLTHFCIYCTKQKSTLKTEWIISRIMTLTPKETQFTCSRSFTPTDGVCNEMLDLFMVL